MHDYILVGSGLTGTLAAEELLASGRSVMMLDIGEEPDARAVKLMRSAAKSLPKAVSRDLIRALDTGAAGAARPRPKTWFGDQTLARWKNYWNFRFESCAEVGPATLRGGYSRVWGASCMPTDLLEQLGRVLAPEGAKTLSRDVLKFLGAREPPKSDGKQGAVEKLVERLRACTPGSTSWRTSPSLLSMDQRAGDCTRCGNCLLGCPIDLIYCSARRIDQLRSNPRFRYVGRQRCVSVSESGAKATVRCLDLSSSTPGILSEFSAARVLLAAGPLATTEILVNGRAIRGAIRMLTSGLFSFPVFSLSAGELFGGATPDSFGLSQAYAYDTAGERPAHFLQFYDCNQVLRHYVAGGLSSGFLGRWTGSLIDRMTMACQGYLDSSRSPSLYFSRADDETAIALRGETRASVENTRAALSLLRKCGYAAGPAKMHLPGDGYHFGGSFPMGGNHGERSSDPLGRPSGAARIHAVDASVLPFIPAGPFTSFSLLNTLRIARELVRLPSEGQSLQ